MYNKDYDSFTLKLYLEIVQYGKREIISYWMTISGSIRKITFRGLLYFTGAGKNYGKSIIVWISLFFINLTKDTAWTNIGQREEEGMGGGQK